MSKSIRNSILPLAGICMSLLLSGCGESTNIQEGAAGSVTECASLLNVDCVPGRLVDDAAANVDYECGLGNSAMVRSITDIDGGFSCPSGSIARFALVNPDKPENRIELGEVKIVQPALIFGGDPTKPVYFYVTPRKLGGDTVGTDFSVRSLNITRLLQTLSDDPVDRDLSGHLPSRRIIITDADKRKITADVLPVALNFSAPVAADPAVPSAGSFDELVSDYLSSLVDPAKHTLITAAQARVALAKGIYNTTAGMYDVPGGSVLTIGDLIGDPDFMANGSFTSADLGAMVGYDGAAGKSFVSSLYMLADRRGRVIGHGVYSFGAKPGTTQWYPWSDPQPMVLVRSGAEAAGLPLWPIDGRLGEFRFQMLGTSDAGKYVRLGQGVMTREAVPGTEGIYENLFRETPVSTLLGTWTMGDLGGSGVPNVGNGKYTLVHSLAVATLMNPDIWSGITFPLPITVTIYNSDYDNTTNPLCTVGRGCKMAEVRMVILEDGNIISDRYKTCGNQVDRETLEVNGNPAQQEIPLGVVANAQSGYNDSATTTIEALQLLAMLPSDPRLNDSMVVSPEFASFLPYLQFGSNLRGSQSLLRVSPGVNQFQMYGYCVAQDVADGRCPVAGIFQPKLGSWINGYTAMKVLQASDDEQPPATIAALRQNAGGLMESRRTDAADCVTLP